MSITDNRLLSILYPAVSRHWLFAIAGIVWTGVGLLLCWRAVVWIDSFPVSIKIIIELFGVILASAGYFFLFSKIVGKNINRISTLPERVCAFAFTAWTGYGMIVLMVTLGITLRNSAFPKYYLSIPYTAMGCMLLMGSFRFYKQFYAVVKEGRQRPG